MKIHVLCLALVASCLGCAQGFGVSKPSKPIPFAATKSINHVDVVQDRQLQLAQHNQPLPLLSLSSAWKETMSRAAASALLLLVSLALPLAALAASGGDLGGGASTGSNAKITTGGASTLQSGRTIAITRGVNLDRESFRGLNLKGVAFQQSIVRDADFSGCNLVGASFFDATVDGSNFEAADMTLANVEMAQFNRANLKNAVLREMYVSGSTLFEGVKNIENSDWTDTYLRAYQQKYLCAHPTAKGTNPTTGADTRESLMCKD
jgi:uncharacterized protein YjbI with pentapeptide repeats